MRVDDLAKENENLREIQKINKQALHQVLTEWIPSDQASLIETIQIISEENKRLKTLLAAKHFQNAAT